MARNPTPTKILELKGAFKKHPDRRRPHEPQPERELGEPPDWLTDAQKSHWHDLAGIAAPGVLTCSERWIVELCCILKDKIVTGTANSTDMSSLGQFLAKLGLTATDRSKVHVNKKQKEGNAFD